MSESSVVVITGTNAPGFGYYLVEEALDAGLRVIATARDIESIRDHEKRGATILELDLTADEEVIKDFAQKAIAVHGKVDILINNAGQGGIASTEEMPLKTFEFIMNVNFYGTLKVTKAFLPYFRERRAGTISQVSTRNADIAMAGLSAYAGSKAAATVFYDALHKELLPFNVRVISFQPGSLRTGMVGKNMKPGSALYPAVDASLKRFAASSGKEPGDPQKQAKRIIEIVTRDGNLPSRFALGQQAFDMISATMADRQKSLQEWKDLSIGLECD
ncbi:NAD(P)-binding protein, partial [Cystobasidium minutum MCA 4210]|uniref:NAD(P)-binding protein n=1 Tax=Cystobasidium minutum MCA 4210 TaxID=1397322 RepID=UPI0034CD50E9|eukprot:jgi/Rhomi1/168863/fgenesh1_kg.3_\